MLQPVEILFCCILYYYFRLNCWFWCNLLNLKFDDQIITYITEQGGLPFDGGDPPSLLSENMSYHDIQFSIAIWRTQCFQAFRHSHFSFIYKLRCYCCTIQCRETIISAILLCSLYLYFQMNSQRIYACSSAYILWFHNASGCNLYRLVFCITCRLNCRILVMKTKERYLQNNLHKIPDNLYLSSIKNQSKPRSSQALLWFFYNRLISCLL